LKHHDNLDSIEQSKYYDINFLYAKSNGLQERDEKIKFLIENDLWSQENEDKIAKLKDSLERYELTQKKLIVKAQKVQNQRKIDEISYELNNYLSERAEMVGETCESFAEKKGQEALLRKTFYKDETLKEPFYTKEEFEELESAEISALYLILGQKFSEFSDKNIRIVSLCPFFLNPFFLCSDNAYAFFGQPISRLTNNQIALYSNGITVKDYASKGNPLPDNILEDPEKAMSWFTFDPESHKKQESKDGGTIVGATIDEMKSSNPNSVDILSLKDQQFKGKDELNMQDMLKLHGY
jgi:hypothetical protein